MHYPSVPLGHWEGQAHTASWAGAFTEKELERAGPWHQGSNVVLESPQSGRKESHLPQTQECSGLLPHSPGAHVTRANVQGNAQEEAGTR